MTILTQFAYSTTLPLSREDAKEDPNGTKLCKAGYLQEQCCQLHIVGATRRKSNIN